MGMFDSFLHPEKGYEKGQEQLDKYYTEAQGQLEPYNQQGQNQYANLNEYIQQLMNPGALQDQWIKQYQESEAARNAEAMAKEHGLDAASSMGLMGSSPALAAIQRGTTNIGLNDRSNYLKDMMEKYLAGAGLSQGIYGQGANSANAMSNNAMNMGNSSAGMAYGAENAGGNLLRSMIGTAGGIAAGALGGPIGIGGAIAGNMFGNNSGANMMATGANNGANWKLAGGR